METIRVESRGGFPLAVALREIVTKLIDDDWARWATDDGSSFYYMLGMKAHMEQEGGRDHNSLAVGSGQAVSVIGEHQVHAQVASHKSDEYYLRQARNRLESAGIGATRIDQFVRSVDSGDFQGGLEGLDISKPGTDRFDAFINLLHALAIRRGVALDELATDVERTHELAVALQKVHLGQLSKLFEGVVKRAGSFEALVFEDRQLNEASRCYLYGFFSATIVLSATAIERCLREVLGQDGLKRVDARVKAKEAGFYRSLVQEAVDRGVLGPRELMGQDPVLAAYSVEVFNLRNEVAHEGIQPESAQAERVITQARQVVEFVRTRGHGGDEA